MFLEISAQVLFKKYYSLDKKNILYIIVGVLLYSMSGFFAFKILDYGSMGLINVVWHMLHFIFLFIVGYLVLGEKYTNEQLFACIMGLASIYLLMTETM